MERVVKSLEETLAQVHITNGVDGICEHYRAGHLTIAIAPVMLDSLKMPLINKNDNFLCRALINLCEEILITLVHKDFLKSGEEDLSRLGVPVDQMLIETLLGEDLRIGLGNLLTVGCELLTVERLSILRALEEVVGNVHTGLVVETIGGLRIQLCTEELDVCTDIFSGFTSILDLNTREPEFEVKAKTVMESESSPVSGKSCKEDELS